MKTTTKPIPLKPEHLKHVSGAGTPIKERPALRYMPVTCDSGLVKNIKTP